MSTSIDDRCARVRLQFRGTLRRCTQRAPAKQHSNCDPEHDNALKLLPSVDPPVSIAYTYTPLRAFKKSARNKVEKAIGRAGARCQPQVCANCFSVAAILCGTTRAAMRNGIAKYS